jgi:hypothetical protein
MPRCPGGKAIPTEIRPLKSIIPALIAVSWRNFVDVAIAPATFPSWCYAIEVAVVDAKRAKSEWESRTLVEFSLFATGYMMATAS